MKNSYVNEPVVKRNSRIALFGLLGGMGILIGGLVFSFNQPDRPEAFAISTAALLLGFLMSQIGMYYMNRWGRKPRPFEILDNSLKGLDNRYRIFHYFRPVNHLLVGPSGLWVLLPQYQSGRITFEKGRWRQKWGGVFALYMRLMAQEGLGRPDIEASAEVEKVRRFMQELFPDEEDFPIYPALVFTHPNVTLDFDQEAEMPALAARADKLKELIRKKGKGKALSQDRVETVRKAILGESEPEEEEEVEETA